MADALTISLDAMGGDVGAPIVISGAERALARLPHIRFAIFGTDAVVEPLLDSHPTVRAASTFHHCEVAVGMDEKPSQALRHGRYRSSMWRSIEAVRNGDAKVAVSAGNTGALMAMSRFCLKTIADIERPAIAGLWPSVRGMSIILDLGATIGANAQQLVDCAVMGGAMARALLGIPRPSIGLLNIGVEEVKGLEEVKEAGRILRAADLPHIAYHGFVEGNDIGRGTVDVVVTEGFSGNIALKTAEGTARQIASYLREEMSSGLMSRIGYLFASRAFANLRQKLDPGQFNGGAFLGLTGIVVKSHGSADADGFASAIGNAYKMVVNGLQQKIEEDLAQSHRSVVGVA